MPTLRHHFAALLSKLNPSESRISLASELPAEVRNWLQDHEFETKVPHTRLAGSYARSTAILDIKDVDVLLYLPKSQLERTPNAVLRDVKSVLDGYPDTTVEVSGQRRSVHMEFPVHGLHLDIVPVVAANGSDGGLKVPDRPGGKWIDSDPLGYADRLSALNQEHGGKVVPLVKIVKGWRDAQMKVRRPKSYVLEVMVVYAVEEGEITLCDLSTAENVADFFDYITAKYDDLMDNGSEAPRIPDPQVNGNFITKGWQREHFETFMRRARDAASKGRKALQADDDAKASSIWATVFGDVWPRDDEVRSAAKAEALGIKPGITKITPSGGVLGGAGPLIHTRPTTYHGD